MQGDFSARGYERLVTALLDCGYEIRSFTSADPGKRHLILRHDIDMSLDAAVALARVEHGLGVQSIYFPLLRSGLYNPFSQRGSSRLREILDAGHRIGLHFDASLYAPDRNSLEAACERECERLEAGIGTRVEVVSFHRPTEQLIGSPGAFANRTHAYEPRFISEMGYCADSRGDWHHGHPLVHEAVAAGRALQLLTHPIWWDTEPGETPVMRLDRLVRERSERFRSELADNCETYREALERRARDAHTE